MMENHAKINKVGTKKVKLMTSPIVLPLLMRAVKILDSGAKAIHHAPTIRDKYSTSSQDHVSPIQYQKSFDALESRLAKYFTSSQGHVSMTQCHKSFDVLESRLVKYSTAGRVILDAYILL